MSSTSLARSSRSSIRVPSAPSGEALRLAGRTVSSGAESNRRRSRSSSAMRYALTRASDSRPFSPCWSTDAHSASCSSGCRAHSACARDTPTSPLSTRLATAGDSLSAITSRMPTQPGFFPHTPAIVFGPSLSSWRKDQTTRASSMGVSVRRGLLARSSATFCSTADSGRSTTTGTGSTPWLCQRSRRLNPSTTSKEPSSARVARTGSSASSSW